MENTTFLKADENATKAMVEWILANGFEFDDDGAGSLDVGDFGDEAGSADFLCGNEKALVEADEYLSVHPFVNSSINTMVAVCETGRALVYYCDNGVDEPATLLLRATSLDELKAAISAR